MMCQSLCCSIKNLILFNCPNALQCLHNLAVFEVLFIPLNITTLMWLDLGKYGKADQTIQKEQVKGDEQLS